MFELDSSKSSSIVHRVRLLTGINSGVQETIGCFTRNVRYCELMLIQARNPIAIHTTLEKSREVNSVIGNPKPSHRIVDQINTQIHVVSTGKLGIKNKWQLASQKSIVLRRIQYISVGSPVYRSSSGKLIDNLKIVLLNSPSCL